jgi:hypothetical protein
MGYGFGGYHSSRIAAFEKRYAAAITLSTPHWDLAGWQQRILDKNKSDPKSVAQSNFRFQWVVNAATPEEAIEIAKKFSLKDVAKNITCPFLVTHGGNGRVVPVENAQKLHDAVGSARKTIKIFSPQMAAPSTPMSTTARSASILRPIGWRRICSARYWQCPDCVRAVVAHIWRADGAASHPELRKRAAAVGPVMNAMNAAAAAGSLACEVTAAE